MADIKLYGFNGSTFVRTIRIGLHEKDVDYDLMPLEMGSEEHLALNPFHKIPIMAHGDTVIYESLAIATYLDAHFGGPRLVPEGEEAVRTMQWVGIYNDPVQKALTMGIVFECVAKPMFGMGTNEATIAENLPKVQHMLPVLDAAVADGGHFGGAEPTLADWYFVPSIAYGLGCPDTADLIAAQPNLSTWFERMNARDSVAVTTPQMV